MGKGPGDKPTEAVAADPSSAPSARQAAPAAKASTEDDEEKPQAAAAAATDLTGLWGNLGAERYEFQQRGNLLTVTAILNGNAIEGSGTIEGSHVHYAVGRLECDGNVAEGGKALGVTCESNSGTGPVILFRLK